MSFDTNLPQAAIEWILLNPQSPQGIAAFWLATIAAIVLIGKRKSRPEGRPTSPNR